MVVGACFIAAGVLVIADASHEPANPELRAAREDIYMPLTAMLLRLQACSDTQCAGATERQTLRLFGSVRSEVVRSPAASTAIKRELAALQRRIRHARNAPRVAGELSGPLDDVWSQIVSELCHPRPDGNEFCDLVYAKD